VLIWINEHDIADLAGLESRETENGTSTARDRRASGMDSLRTVLHYVSQAEKNAGEAS
jgi:hypothetical protein